MAGWTAVDQAARRLFQVRHALGVLHLEDYERQALLELADNLELKFRSRGLSTAGAGVRLTHRSPRCCNIEPLELPVLISGDDSAARGSRAGRLL